LGKVCEEDLGSNTIIHPTKKDDLESGANVEHFGSLGDGSYAGYGGSHL
jgi:hypothetical protein